MLNHQEFVPLHKQKKKDIKVKDNVYCYQWLLSSVHGSDCNTFFRLHRELRIQKSLREIQVGWRGRGLTDQEIQAGWGDKGIN